MLTFPRNTTDKNIIETADSFRWLSTGQQLDMPNLITAMSGYGYRLDKIEPPPDRVSYPDGRGAGSVTEGHPLNTYAIRGHRNPSDIALIHDFGAAEAPVASSRVSELLDREPTTKLAVEVCLPSGKLATTTIARSLGEQQAGSVVVSGVDSAGTARAAVVQDRPSYGHSREVNRAAAERANRRSNRNLNAEANLLEFNGRVQAPLALANALSNEMANDALQHRRLLQQGRDVGQAIEDHYAPTAEATEHVNGTRLLPWRDDIAEPAQPITWANNILTLYRRLGER